MNVNQQLGARTAMNHPETATVLRSISDMVSTETNPRRKSRLEQLIYATASAWPHYPIAHAAQAAVQLARPMRVFELQSFEGVKHALHHIDLRPALEWDIMGFPESPDTLPILLSDLRDPLTPPLLCHLNPRHAPLTDPHIDASRRRRGPFHATPSYAGFHPSFTDDTARMLGNIAKIGAVATWEKTLVDAASWAELPHPPVIVGDTPPSTVTPDNAWYQFRVGKHLGRDAFAEIVMCLGHVFCHHVPQVWSTTCASQDADPTTMLIKAEAAGALAIARVGGPTRRGGSFFGDALLKEGTPLPAGFRLDVVLHAASEIEDLLRGDTTAVVSGAWSVEDRRGY